MAKVTIDAEDLPQNVAPGEDYVVRMRVVSLDENRTSYWIYYKVRKPDTDSSVV
jgi:hypothetical protein